MNTECNNIEAYLAGDLQVEQAVDFEDHLPQCDACRETIDQQRWIDGLLRSPLRLQVEPTPVDLIVATCRAAFAASPKRATGRLRFSCGRVAHPGCRLDRIPPAAKQQANRFRCPSVTTASAAHAVAKGPNRDVRFQRRCHRHPARKSRRRCDRRAGLSDHRNAAALAA